MSQSFTDATHLRDEQYKTSSNLKKRRALYEHSRGSSEPDWYDFALSHLALSPGASVIDFGCGYGAIWQKAKSRGSLPPDLTLVDLSEGMLQEAEQTLGAGPTYLAHDLNTALEVNRTFDVMTAFHMLYHLDDPIGALERMMAHLKPGGRAVISLNQPGGFAKMYRLINAFEGKEVVPPNGINPPPHPDLVTQLLEGRFESSEQIVAAGNVNVTDAKPLFDYILSMETLHGNRYQEAGRRDVFFDFIAQEVERAVKDDGALILQKAAVLLKFENKKST